MSCGGTGIACDKPKFFARKKYMCFMLYIFEKNKVAR
jgi:hypothetical protein